MMNHIEQFSAAMAAAGLHCADPLVDDGTLRRYHVTGDRPGTRNGWYCLYADAPQAGVFGSWRAGVTRYWSARTYTDMTAAQRAQHRRRIEDGRRQRRLEQQRRWEFAERKAVAIWDAARPAASGHSYLRQKDIPSRHLRQVGDCLLIPLYEDDRLVNLQKINEAGEKRFLPGGKITGCCSPLGRVATAIYICEGWATACTLFSHTGQHTVAAMTAGNLKAVALAYRGRYASHRIVIAADNDRFTPGNPGLMKAMEAASAVGGEYVSPTFPEGAAGTDWNDLHNLEKRRCSIR
jgi:putative DNA primase/helicase